MIIILWNQLKPFECVTKKALYKFLQAASKAPPLRKQMSTESKDEATKVVPLEIDDTAMFQRKKSPSISLEDSVSLMRKVG